MTDKVDKFLAHYGIRGMKWGVRRKAPAVPEGEVHVVQKKAGQRLTAAGGAGFKPHEDAVKAVTSKQIARVSSLDALSTKDLQAMVSRMDLEQRYAKLMDPNASKSSLKRGKDKLNELLEAKDTAKRFVNDPFIKKQAGIISKDIGLEKVAQKVATAVIKRTVRG